MGGFPFGWSILSIFATRKILFNCDALETYGHNFDIISLSKMTSLEVMVRFPLDINFSALVNTVFLTLAHGGLNVVIVILFLWHIWLVKFAVTHLHFLIVHMVIAHLVLLDLLLNHVESHFIGVVKAVRGLWADPHLVIDVLVSRWVFLMDTRYTHYLLTAWSGTEPGIKFLSHYPCGLESIRVDVVRGTISVWNVFNGETLVFLFCIVHHIA